MFGLCHSNAVQREFHPMLCRAGSSRLGSIKSPPVATKACLGLSGISQPLCLALRSPCHQGPNLRFNSDRLRRPR